MARSPHSIQLQDADSTARFAERLAARLNSGDVVLLSGPVGAGKTHFARALVQSILDFPEDVPSPTFTLVQSYDTRHGPLWHADLYRINTESEVEELGLEQAFEEAICLIEWPDRLGSLTPPNALNIHFKTTGSGRTAHLTWDDARWDDKLSVEFLNA